jgi:hypothetical protein
MSGRGGVEPIEFNDEGKVEESEDRANGGEVLLLLLLL